ncbi:hypothetical protein R1sor_012085 [Riccia sorocarpa]|uniref:Uncharacterized protein n=1 Tax=Riccia sorocarpa TaxID=122646 RepID=A0ABD3I652_9MARC
MSWHRPVSRVERADNGWRIRANNLFLAFPWHTWFCFPIDTIVTIPTIFSDLRRGMDREHTLDWGRFELPAEFKIPRGYDILLPTYAPYGIHEGTVRMPIKKKCRIILRADMRYKMEDPDDPAACSFWMEETFKEGDIVCMFVEKVRAAEGTVVSVLPSFTVHTVELSNDNVDVRIDKIIKGLHPLPYPHMDATSLGEVEKGSNLRWPRNRLRKFITGEDGVSWLEDTGDQNEEVRVQCSQTPPSRLSVIAPTDYTIRQNWNFLEVHVLLKLPDGKKVAVAEGLVTLTAPAASVNNKELGELNVGVVITQISGCVDLEILRGTSLASFSGSPMLVSWPLRRVIAKKSGRSLHSLQHNLSDEDMSEVQLSSADDMQEDVEDTPKCLSNSKIPELGPPQKKRHYNSTIRKTSDPARRAKAEARKKARLHTTDERIRQHEDAIDQGKHIIDQTLICKMAFWTIYGFSKSKYYAMMAKASQGIVRGYHGDKRRLKPRGSTVQAHAVLGQLLTELAEPMPHMQRTQEDGSSVIVYMLPSCYTKKSIMEEVNCKIESIGGETISKSLFYRNWKASCRNYKFHKRGAFTKCDTCVTLKLKLMEERRPDFRRPIEEERNKHMSEQMSRRNVYYAKRALAKAQPEKYLCLIHDKMDQNKTNIPRLANNMKRLHSRGSCMPLHVSLTGMLTHGREPGAFCHLSVNGLWPGDPNFTVSSLARCLRDLEFVPDGGDHTGDLSRTTSNIPLFSSLLDQSAFIATMGSKGAIDSTYFQQHGNGNMRSARDTVRSPTFKKLPPVLMLQMDNSAKDNKNLHVLAFCSELVIRGVFETVELNFLMVGHTHEDVDALFSKVSAQTMHKDVLSLPALMVEIWDSEIMHPVPILLEEVADYKSYVHGFLKPLEGHSKPLGFRFSMVNNVPVYRYQRRVDRPWISEAGISLWKKVDGRYTVPDGEPMALKLPSSHPRLGEISPFISNLTDFLRTTYRDTTSEGRPRKRPKRAFIPLEDITKGKFVVLRPDDDFEKEVPRVVWLGRAIGAVMRETSDERHGQFLIEWWRPRHRKSTNATNKERYTDILVGQKDWEKDPGYFTPEWINATAAIYSWKYRSKGGVPQSARLNPLAKAAIEAYFQMLDLVE